MEKRNQNNQQSQKDLKYINVPLSIVKKQWFKGENAVRAWFFYAWNALMSRYDADVMVKGQTFHLTEGETICTRSYLSESLGIKDSMAKSSTDSLKRTGAIAVKQEVISKDINNAKNSVSRVAVNGIPTPNEPYVKMYFPVDVADFWSTPYLAQLYTYMVCNAWHENTWIVGTGCHAQQITPGDFLFSYEKVAKALKCNQWRFKELLKLLENIGAITRVKRVGNRGVLIHLNLYPQAKQQVKTNDSANKGLEAHVEQSKPTSSPTPSVKPVAAKNEVMNPSRQISKEILDTPVTEAIKYLFFNKKKNKDIDRLNDIISYVNENMPSDFPVEQLKPAMDYYFKEYGDDYIERKKVVKAIGEFKGLLASSLSTKANRESKIQELNRQIAEEENKYKAFNEKWKTIGENFKMYMEKEDWISTLNPETIDSMYHTLWYANLKGTFVEESLLKKGKSINCPSSWDAQTSKWANYIVRFFGCIDNVDALREIYRAISENRYAEFRSIYEKKTAELNKLKNVI